MKKEIFHINIPTPCTENWNEMTPTERGAFCAHCQKEVVDFTEKTPSEIAAYFAKNKGKNCGRFYKKQLDKEYKHYQPEKQNNLKYAASLALGLLVSENSFAQDEIKKEKVEISEVKNKNIDKSNTSSDSIIIRGFVLDDMNDSLIGVNVLVENTNVGTVTEIDGSFELRVSKLPVKLLFQYVGYENDSLEIKKGFSKNTIVKMKMTNQWMGEVVIVEARRNDDVYSGFPNNNIHREKKRKKD